MLGKPAEGKKKRGTKTDLVGASRLKRRTGEDELKRMLGKSSHIEKKK